MGTEFDHEYDKQATNDIKAVLTDFEVAFGLHPKPRRQAMRTITWNTEETTSFTPPDEDVLIKIVGNTNSSVLGLSMPNTHTIGRTISWELADTVRGYQFHLGGVGISNCISPISIYLNDTVRWEKVGKCPTCGHEGYAEQWVSERWSRLANQATKQGE